MELASGLAKRSHDCRHAGISFWPYSGVDPAECARRAGQSIEVLFQHSTASAKEQHLPGKSVIWSMTGPEALVRSETAVGGSGGFNVDRPPR